MKRIRLIVTGLLVLCFFGACSDFLKEKSADEVLVKSTRDYSELILGYMYTTSVYNLLYVLDDNLQFTQNPNVSGSYTTYFGCFTWQPDMWEMDVTLGSGYDDTYSQLMGINAVIDGIDDAVGSQAEKEQVKAEALGIRAFYYYLLVNLYGEPYNYNKKALGVPLKLTAGLLENGIARNTVEEVYNQIVKDLEEASRLFEKYPKQRGNYRINVSAVNTLLSRVYLDMEKWNKAIETANKAIETAEGLTDYTKLSTEQQFYMATYAHSEVEWLFGENNVSILFSPSADLLSKYKNNDLRVKFWFASDRMSVLKKKVTSKTPTNTIRISEAYLNRAEAYAQSGQDMEALFDLNELRRHRIVDYQDVSITDSKVLLEEIRVERRLELCFDGCRWFDLRRYGMPSISHDYKEARDAAYFTYTLREKDPLYTLPIPSLMIKNNIKLQQNASAYESQRQGSPKLN